MREIRKKSSSGAHEIAETDDTARCAIDSQGCPNSLEISADPVRRFSLIATLLVGGALFSLPFRRPVSVDELHQEPVRQRRGMDRDSIEMLVREVTEGVEVPIFFDPGPSQEALPFASRPQTENTLPLTYEASAVPLPPDPIYRDRFDATVAAQAPTPRTNSERSEAVMAELEQRFSEKPLALGFHSVREHHRGASVPVAIPARTSSPNPPTFGKSFREAEQPRTLAVPAGTATKARLLDSAASANGDTTQASRSVLSALPAPRIDADPDADGRTRHWIRQPD
ncbi:MAG: hypothetical protein AAF802_05055 [Planctomycetota bacterium]